MKFEQQVVSLELTKTLINAFKNSNTTMPSPFWFWHDYKGEPSLSQNAIGILPEDEVNIYPAYSVAELGEMLPMNVMPKAKNKATNGNGYWLTAHKENGRWSIAYESGRVPELHNAIADTEANARAKMLIYLLENNLLTPKQ